MRKRIFAALTLMISLLFVAVYPETVGVAADPADKIFEINTTFMNYDGSPATFDRTGEVMKLGVTSDGTNFKSTTYSYMWSDGETVDGAQTDADGMIVISRKGTAPVDSLRIRIANVEPTEFIAGKDINYANVIYGMVAPTGGAQSIIDPMKDADGTSVKFYFQAGQSSDYRAAMIFMPVKYEITTELSFVHYTDGTPMTLSAGDILPVELNNVVSGQSRLNCSYKVATDTGYEYAGNLSSNGNTGIDLMSVSDHLEGVNKVTVTIYGMEPNISIVPNGDKYWRFSDLSVNGEKFAAGQNDVVSGVSGDPIRLVFREPVVYEEGTISFETIDGTIPSDTQMSFSFALTKHNGYNFDLKNFYWTADSDPSVKHYADSKRDYTAGSTASTKYTYAVTIPLGESITLHNMPAGAMFHEADTFTSNLFDSNAGLNGGTWIMINGEQSTKTTAEENGYIPEVYNVPTNGSDDSLNVEIQTSGSFYGMGYTSSGFAIRFYLLHQSEQFMFNKEYDPNDKTTEPDKVHDFEVTLKDASGNPYTNKVAYYICDSLDTVIDEDKDVAYATPDADGKFTIGLKAGQYVKIGRSINDSVLDYHLRRGQGWPDQVMINERTLGSLQNGCFPSLGMLPYGIEYEVKEVSTDYTAKTTGATSGTLDSKSGASFYDLRTGHTLADFKAIMDQDASLPATTFVNTRKTGTLALNKVVTGLDNGKKDFTLDIEFKDSGKSFPDALTCMRNDGTTSTVSVVKGDNGAYKAQVTLKNGETAVLSGIPSGATYKVTESASSAEGFTVIYSNAEGTISSQGSVVTVTNAGPSASSGRTTTGDNKATPTPTPTATPTATPNKSSYSVSTGEEGNNNVFLAAGSLAIAALVIGARICMTRGLSRKEED